MKLGVMSALFSGRPLEDVCHYVADIGLGAIELPVGAWPGAPYFDPAKVLASRKEQDRIKGILRDHGLLLSGLAVHGNPVHPDKGFARRHHQQFATAVQLAPKLGTEVVITFSGCPGGSRQDRTPNWVTCPWPGDFSDILKYQWDEVLVPYWAQQAKFAAKHGVRVAWEAHPGFCVYNGETIIRLSELAQRKAGMRGSSARRDSCSTCMRRTPSSTATRGR
jgi:sugar phosphate isomerase/epimerase